MFLLFRAALGKVPEQLDEVLEDGVDVLHQDGLEGRTVDRGGEAEAGRNQIHGRGLDVVQHRP